MKIDLRIPSMKEQVIHEQLAAYIILHDTHIESVLEFYCSETKDDDPEIWDEDVLRSYATIFLKSSIIGTTVQRNHKQDKWMLTIYTANQNMDTYFDHEKDCRELGTKINNWLIGSTT